MTKKSKLSALPASLCVGGYSGWVLTVMYICERSLYYYRDDSMLDSVNITFLYAMTAALAVLIIVLLLFDIEGVLSNKLLRLMPGVFMMESGIALCVANPNSMKVFSAFAGAAAAFGMLAVLSQLLRIKVGLRMRTIGFGLVIGSAARLLAVWIISSSSQKYFFWTAVGMGVITALTVHSTGFSFEEAPLVSRAEAAPPVILRKLPSAYIWLFLLCGCFWMSSTSIEKTGRGMLPAGMDASYYELFSYSGWLAAALAVALFVTLSRLPMLFVCTAGMAAASGCLALLPHFSSEETKIFAVICFAATACHKAFVLLFIIVFSLDRPHPLFYAVTGYAVSAAGELAGNLIRVYHPVDLSRLILLLLIVMPLGGIVLGRIMRRSGLSKASFDRRHTMRSEIRRRAAELELFEREQMMVECVVLNGYNVDELASKLIFSRNTVRALLRPVLQKFEVDNLEELRDHFEKLTAEAEIRQERVQEAELEQRSEKRMESVSGLIRSWRERLYERDAAREKKAREKAGKSRKTSQTARIERNERVVRARSSAKELSYELDEYADTPESDTLSGADTGEEHYDPEPYGRSGFYSGLEDDHDIDDIYGTSEPYFDLDALVKADFDDEYISDVGSYNASDSGTLDGYDTDNHYDGDTGSYEEPYNESDGGTLDGYDTNNHYDDDTGSYEEPYSESDGGTLDGYDTDDHYDGDTVPYEEPENDPDLLIGDGLDDE